MNIKITIEETHSVQGKKGRIMKGTVIFPEGTTKMTCAMLEDAPELFITTDEPGIVNAEWAPTSVIIDGVQYFPGPSTFNIGISAVGVLNLSEGKVEE